MAFILGISITFNILAIIGIILMYKFSYKGLYNKIENMALKNFTNFDIDFDKFKKGDF